MTGTQERLLKQVQDNALADLRAIADDAKLLGNDADLEAVARHLENQAIWDLRACEYLQARVQGAVHQAAVEQSNEHANRARRALGYHTPHNVSF